jgi:hypothetical protein
MARGGEQVRSTERDVNSLTRRVERLERARPALGNQLPRPLGGAWLFNAAIDPILTGAIPSEHLYPNLATLVEYEDWDDEHQFNIAMIDRPGTPCVDASAVTTPGPFCLQGLGPTGGRLAGSNSGDRPEWDVRSTITVGTTTKGATIAGVRISKGTTGLLTQLFSGDVHFDNTVIDCTATSTRRIESPCTGFCTAVDSVFDSAIFAAGAVLIGCHYQVNVSADYTVTSSDLLWRGGSISSGGSSVVLTFGGTDTYISVARHNDAFETSGGTCTLSFVGTSDRMFCEMYGMNNTWNITVGANPHNVTVLGNYNNITVSGNASDRARKIDATHDAVADITGPAKIDLASGTNAARVIIRGDGVKGDVQISGTPTPAIDFIGADYCYINAALNASSAAGKPYAIDAGSADSILIWTGLNSGWTTGGTNASGTTVVKDHTNI